MAAVPSGVAREDTRRYLSWEGVRRFYCGARGGNRTPRPFGQGILSPLRLPFRHPGICIVKPFTTLSSPSLWLCPDPCLLSHCQLPFGQGIFPPKADLPLAGSPLRLPFRHPGIIDYQRLTELSTSHNLLRGVPVAFSFTKGGYLKPERESNPIGNRICFRACRRMKLTASSSTTEVRFIYTRSAIDNGQDEDDNIHLSFRSLSTMSHNAKMSPIQA